MPNAYSNTLEDYWTPEVIAHSGYTALPNLLFEVNYHIPTKEKRLSPTELMLLACLASYRRHTRAKIFPTHKQLCLALSITENTLRAAKKALVDKGWLAIKPKAGGRGHYYDLSPTTERLRELSKQAPVQQEVPDTETGCDF